MKFAFVCVNYNNSRYTGKMIDSLLANKGFDIDIVVVDNASDPSDKESLERLCSHPGESVQIIWSKENLGYFGGLNLGIARARKADYVVIGNNDLEYSASFCQVLAASVYPADVSIVAPNVVTLDGYNQNPHCRQRIGKIRKMLYSLYFTSYSMARLLTWGSFLKLKLSGGRDNTVDQESGYIYMGIGACYVLLPSFFEYFEELANKVFLYGEEAILAGQLSRVSRKMYYDSSLLVKHAESASTSKVPGKKKYDITRKSYRIYKEYL